LIIANDPTLKLHYDSDTLKGLSDHILITTQIPLPSWPATSSEKQANPDPKHIYKWVEGSGIKDYAQSAQSWTDFTGKEEFITEFTRLVESTEISNEERAAAVE
jgi:hypothetical protein